MKLIAPLPREAHGGGVLVMSHRRGGRQLLIEGSWQRLEADRPARPTARASRRVTLVWAALSLAAVASGALVSAQGGLEAPMTAHAAVASDAAQTEPVTPASAPAAEVSRAAGAATGNPTDPPDREEQIAATRLSPMTEEAAAVNLQAASEPATIVAALPLPEKAAATRQSAAPHVASHVETPPQARLPRPRPEPRIAFASIERRWAEIRALRNPALYPLIRPRFLHRYRLPPL